MSESAGGSGAATGVHLRDAFRVRGQEERRGRAREQREARWRSGDGGEDAVRLLLSRLICSRRGEVFVYQAVLSQVRPRPGTCLTCLPLDFSFLFGQRQN